MSGQTLLRLASKFFFKFSIKTILPRKFYHDVHFCHVISLGCKVCTSNPGHLTIFSQFFCNIFVQAICTECTMYCIAHYQISLQDPSCTNLTDTRWSFWSGVGLEEMWHYFLNISSKLDILSRPPKLHWNCIELSSYCKMVKLRGCSVHVFHCKSELVSADKSKKGLG